MIYGPKMKVVLIDSSKDCGLREAGVHKKRGGAQDNYEGFTITIYWG